MKAADRICCDGQCCDGRACPLTANQRRPASEQRLAPGVIAGPYRAQSLARSRAPLFLAFIERLAGPPSRKGGR